MRLPGARVWAVLNGQAEEGGEERRGEGLSREAGGERDAYAKRAIPELRDSEEEAEEGKEGERQYCY